MKRSAKTFLIMIGLFAAFEALYQVFLYLEQKYFPLTPVCMTVLGIIVSVLLAAIIILNGGFDKADVTPDSFRSTIQYEERVKLAEKQNKRKKAARILMLFFIPLAVVFSLDLIDTFYGVSDSFKGWFG